ncbi:NAD-dependent epimerase/dehydratase family protein [Vibrio sp. Of14-4]|uniref:NAD-dependent epimerase/dehydratase family protein n=1 Tax=Vibrio sp. Of14-4 TaxID=2724878 RepID=UPI001EF2FC56|nr:NAD-dependent epimerase/dehydratase family protein [Vibrio sp. Of14-4]MCG7489646.1 NAD-dependent epimerase/dehydratase family protein [Vibrio sp. Of14-4]
MIYFEIRKKLILDPKIWLVTGCAGFIGSNLVEELLKLNQKVIGLDNFSTGYQHNLEQIKRTVSLEQWRKFEFIEGDITDYEVCAQVTRGVDVVLHQAALGSVPRSLERPVDSNAANVSGFLNMLTAAKDNDVGRFVFASSSSVYGDSQELPKLEKNIGRLLSPYAVTKYVNELYMDVFYKSYRFESIGLRYFNVFGKRQSALGAYAAVMPKWIASMIKNQPVFIYGDGETSRDFTYIDNVVQANILAGTTKNPKAMSQSFNIAAGGRETLNNLYSSIRSHLNTSQSELIYKDFRQGDIRHSNANIDKAKELLGYMPTHNLEQGLIESIDWYVGNLSETYYEKQ